MREAGEHQRGLAHTYISKITFDSKITSDLVGADSFRPARPATPWPQPTGSAARSAHARRGCTQALTDEPCASRTSQFTSSSSHPPRHRPGLVRVATGPKATRRVTSHSPPRVCRLVGPRPGRSASLRRLTLGRSIRVGHRSEAHGKIVDVYIYIHHYFAFFVVIY